MQIDISHLSRVYGSGPRAVRALNDVSLSLSGATCWGLLGRNGSGKSTLLRCILGLLEPTSGTVTWSEGSRRCAPDRVRQVVGFCMEERALPKVARVEDTIQYIGLLKGLSRREAKLHTERLIRRFELTSHRGSRISALSKGLAQRVQLATALVHSPKVLLLDEPFSGLDVEASRDLRDLILDLRSDGTLIVISSHQMQLVEDVCDHVAFLHKGDLILHGAIHELRARRSPQTVLVDAKSQPEGLPGVESVRETRRGKVVTLSDGESFERFLMHLAAEGKVGTHVTRYGSSLEELFISAVKGDAT